MPGSIQQGYLYLASARAAYQYVLERNWIHVAGTVPVPRGRLKTTVLSDTAHLEFLDDNSVNRDVASQRFYVVYSGRRPGIYKS